jgi:sRNA-binding carbon storage regulator CsrA
LIGDDIVVRISKIEGGRVQVFIKTPEDIVILRPDKDADQLDRELARSGHNFDRDENE